MFIKGILRGTQVTLKALKMAISSKEIAKGMTGRNLFWGLWLAATVINLYAAVAADWKDSTLNPHKAF